MGRKDKNESINVTGRRNTNESTNVMGRGNRNESNNVMGKKKKGESFIYKLRGRKIPFRDREIFLHRPRSQKCLALKGSMFLEVHKLDANFIKTCLALDCPTIEHQFIRLRLLTQLTPEDYKQRCIFTIKFLSCLSRHHNVSYEGILFGSTVNGLGFRDSDVDLRLRQLKEVEEGIYEPVALNRDMIERILRNVAFQTTNCCLSVGDFVPSTRCPVARLTFYKGELNPFLGGYPNLLQEGLKYDVSLSSSNPLASFNSKFLRFLCDLEPRFHLLATVLRYWSNIHTLIVTGYLSSYALVNMLIFFCQTVEPPLLPTVDQMRDLYCETCLFKSEEQSMDEETRLRGFCQLEWHCLVCLEKECYEPSTNTEPLSVLLLKFFEFCLNFPYSTHIMTIRPGRALSHKEFESTTQYHPRFSIKSHLNIQDPFDLKHNLTSGMSGGHFQRFIVTVRYSYERLFDELLNNFTIPTIFKTHNGSKQPKGKIDPRVWGLNTLFVKLTDQEYKEAQGVSEDNNQSITK